MENAIPIKDKLPTDVKNRYLYFHLKYIYVYEEFHVLLKSHTSLWRILCLIKIIYKFMKNSRSY
jgi:hypothetical protein